MMIYEKQIKFLSEGFKDSKNRDDVKKTIEEFKTEFFKDPIPFKNEQDKQILKTFFGLNYSSAFKEAFGRVIAIKEVKELIVDYLGFDEKEYSSHLLESAINSLPDLDILNENEIKEIIHNVKYIMSEGLIINKVEPLIEFLLSSPKMAEGLEEVIESYMEDIQKSYNSTLSDRKQVSQDKITTSKANSLISKLKTHSNHNNDIYDHILGMSWSRSVSILTTLAVKHDEIYDLVDFKSMDEEWKHKVILKASEIGKNSVKILSSSEIIDVMDEETALATLKNIITSVTSIDFPSPYTKVPLDSVDVNELIEYMISLSHIAKDDSIDYYLFENTESLEAWIESLSMRLQVKPLNKSVTNLPFNIEGLLLLDYPRRLNSFSNNTSANSLNSQTQSGVIHSSEISVDFRKNYTWLFMGVLSYYKLSDYYMDKLFDVMETLSIKLSRTAVFSIKNDSIVRYIKENFHRFAKGEILLTDVSDSLKDEVNEFLTNITYGGYGGTSFLTQNITTHLRVDEDFLRSSLPEHPFYQTVYFKDLLPALMGTYYDELIEYILEDGKISFERGKFVYQIMAPLSESRGTTGGLQHLSSVSILELMIKEYPDFIKFTVDNIDINKLDNLYTQTISTIIESSESVTDYLDGKTEPEDFEMLKETVEYLYEELNKLTNYKNKNKIDDIKSMIFDSLHSLGFLIKVSDDTQL